MNEVLIKSIKNDSEIKSLELLKARIIETHTKSFVLNTKNRVIEEIKDPELEKK